MHLYNSVLYLQNLAVDGFYGELFYTEAVFIARIISQIIVIVSSMSFFSLTKTRLNNNKFMMTKTTDTLVNE